MSDRASYALQKNPPSRRRRGFEEALDSPHGRRRESDWYAIRHAVAYTHDVRCCCSP